MSVSVVVRNLYNVDDISPDIFSETTHDGGLQTDKHFISSSQINMTYEKLHIISTGRRCKCTHPELVIR